MQSIIERDSLARKIDHTLLKPEATEDDLRGLCREAREHGFASACVNPGNVRLASELLRGSGVKVCAVVGFPLGAATTAAKAWEAREALSNGAEEIDMGMNVGALKSGKADFVLEDVRAVRGATGGKVLKVILETCLLTDEEKIRACLIAQAAGADFVKTSTGFSSAGATVRDVKLMKETVGASMGIKASGGIKTYEAAKHLIDAGATRIGTSSSVSIINLGGDKKNG